MVSFYHIVCFRVLCDFYGDLLLFVLTGIVIKYENMSYRIAVHHAHLILSLYGKAIKYARDLFDPPDVSLLGVFSREKREFLLSYVFTFFLYSFLYSLE